MFRFLDFHQGERVNFRNKINNPLKILCLFFLFFLSLILTIAQSAGAVEYTDCTSAEG